MQNKEKIIIGVLVVIFLAVLSGMIWDLYGQKLLTKSSNSQATPTTSVAADYISSAPNKKGSSNKPTKSAGNKAVPSQETVAYASYSTCLENTKDERVAKDCCDCLGGDASLHKACRDAAATYDFTKNTVFKTFEIPSNLGKEGDYSVCTASGNQQQCKQCCEASGTKFVCGDFQFCRTACNSLAQ